VDYNTRPTRVPPLRSMHHLNARRLSVGQFMERACRLAVGGASGFMAWKYAKRLCQRRESICGALSLTFALFFTPSTDLKPL